MSDTTRGHLPIYDQSGKNVVAYREHSPDGAGTSASPIASAAPAQDESPDYGFEAYLAHLFTDAGGMQMSGADRKTGWVFGAGPHAGKSKEQLMQLARQQWSQMLPEQRQRFQDIGNNRDIRGGGGGGGGAAGLPLAGPSSNGGQTEAPRFAARSGGLPITTPGMASTGLDGKPNTGAGPVPTANARFNAMGQQQADAAATARAGAQQVTDFYAENPGAYVDRQTQARDAELAKSGIHDMGGGQRIMNNQHGSGFVTQGPPHAFGQGKVFDERGQVDLVASRDAGKMVYKKDATGNTAMHPTTQEAKTAIQAQQNILAGAGLPIGAPNTPEARRADDRKTAIDNLPTSPAFNATVQQSATNAIARGTAITNRELTQPTNAQRQLQSAASALPLPVAPAPPTASPPEPFTDRRPAFV